MYVTEPSTLFGTLYIYIYIMPYSLIVVPYLKLVSMHAKCSSDLSYDSLCLPSSGKKMNVIGNMSKFSYLCVYPLHVSIFGH